MLGMTRGLILHNSMQLSIPFWLLPLFMVKIPSLEFFAAGTAAVLGTILPDIDHFAMWNKVKHRGIVDFLRFCVRADRYRKAFLPLHNYVSLAGVSVIAGMLFFVNVYWSLFFVAFAVHLVFDLMADVYMIRQRAHWRLRNWLGEADGNGTNNIRLPVAQQVQPRDKQKHYA